MYTTYRTLAILAIAFNSATASLIPSPLFTRDSASCPTNFNSCSGDTTLPTNFCCASTSTCIVLADNATVICCPQGQKCDFIQPITCDIQQLNATANPENPAHTTQLGQNLTVCGNLCCPPAYMCKNGGCQRNDEPAAPPSSSSPKPTTTSGLGPTLKPEQTTSSSSTSPTPSPSSSGYPAKAVVAGFFPGFILGIISSLGLIMCLGRRRTKTRISSPILVPDNHRTDFLRSNPSNSPLELANKTPSRASTISRVRSLFRRDTQRTQKSDMSTEEISVFAQGLSANERMTRFGDVLEGGGRDGHAPPVPRLAPEMVNRTPRLPQAQGMGNSPGVKTS
ncbi:MAG: hypothetical protein M1824_002057 [Vezdaea acicularis]|nr:MAG: hypothetical protein M1824_002057 [Vezdaea acicularis]